MAQAAPAPYAFLAAPAPITPAPEPFAPPPAAPAPRVAPPAKCYTFPILPILAVCALLAGAAVWSSPQTRKR